MSHSSLIQLAAQGVENVDLTVDADHTFWKSSYAKHTGFAMEPKEVSVSSGSEGFGKKPNFKIERQGDLVTDVWLVFDLGADNQLASGWRYSNDIGRALIEEVSIKIGGVIYDTRIGEYYHAFEELTVGDELHLNKLSGKTEVEDDLIDWAKEPQKIYVPIRFWFTDNYANSLPLVGLYQHDVTIEFKLRSKANCTHRYSGAAAVGSGGELTNMVLLCEYIFLENNERNYFARGTHKYMIEQVQHVGTVSVDKSKKTLEVDIHFNHPTSELIWFFRRTDRGAGDGTEAEANNYFNFEGEEAAPFAKDAFLDMRLLLNNSERWTKRDPLYFRSVLPRRVHSRIPRKQIYAYAFALHPEQAGTDPSGNINFSRIDNSQLRFTFTDVRVHDYDLFVFARSVNWAKIERGLGKLYYA